MRHMLNTSLIAAGAMLLLGAGAHAAQPAGLTLNTPISVIAADPQGKAVLQHDLPGLLTNPQYPMFSSMSLTSVAAMSNGKLGQAKLARVQKDLGKIKPAG